MKLLQFHSNYRPAYWGTWRKKSSHISARCPFRQDKVNWCSVVPETGNPDPNNCIKNDHYWELWVQSLFIFLSRRPTQNTYTCSWFHWFMSAGDLFFVLFDIFYNGCVLSPQDLLDYEVDSDEEWEEEEPGESLSHSEGVSLAQLFIITKPNVTFLQSGLTLKNLDTDWGWIPLQEQKSTFERVNVFIFRRMKKREVRMMTTTMAFLFLMATSQRMKGRWKKR